MSGLLGFIKISPITVKRPLEVLWYLLCLSVLKLMTPPDLAAKKDRGGEYFRDIYIKMAFSSLPEEKGHFLMF
jgi:hypothetical protein